MTDTELRDELMTLLTAGHETTATGLAWAFERLLRTPRVLERLTSSLDDDEYLEAVVKETLRVRPVIVDVARKLTRETEVAGWRLPAGTLVAAGDRRAAHAPGPVRRRRRSSGPSAGSRAPRSRTPGSRSAAACGAASAPRSRRWRCGPCCARCCGACGSARPEQRPERGVIRHVTVVPGRGARAVIEERLAVEPAAELAGAQDARTGGADAPGQVAV